MNWQSFFKGKKITQMGLGLLGRGVGDAEFLARHGADLLVTDLKNANQLAFSLERLKSFKNISYVLGEHRLGDFREKDFILKAAGVPLDSPYVAEARKNGIPIEMDASLFVKLAPKATIIGVTGTRGKSTTTILIYEILKAAGKRVFLGGNIKDTATLPLLEKLNQPDGEGDFVVLELDSWQLQGFKETRLSPHIAVFTTFMSDHMNYYKGNMDLYFEDKTAIFGYQSENDYLVVGEDIVELFHNCTKSKLIVAKRSDVAESWRIHIPGEHNKLNIACAVKVADILKIRHFKVRGAISNFKGLAGRLEFVKIVKGVRIYNDSNSTTPDATLAGLRAVADNRNVILIIGGSDKKLDMGELVRELPKYCKAVVLLDGTGTRNLVSTYGFRETDGLAVDKATSLKEALEKAVANSHIGDIILFSPAFASFDMFKNEYDRGEKFIKEVATL